MPRHQAGWRRAAGSSATTNLQNSSDPPAGVAHRRAFGHNAAGLRPHGRGFRRSGCGSRPTWPGTILDARPGRTATAIFRQCRWKTSAATSSARRQLRVDLARHLSGLAKQIIGAEAPGLHLTITSPLPHTSAAMNGRAEPQEQGFVRACSGRRLPPYRDPFQRTAHAQGRRALRSNAPMQGHHRRTSVTRHGRWQPG